MKIGQKLIVVFIAVSFLIGVVGFFSVVISQKSLKESMPFKVEELRNLVAEILDI